MHGVRNIYKPGFLNANTVHAQQTKGVHTYVKHILYSNGRRRRRPGWGEQRDVRCRITLEESLVLAPDRNGCARSRPPALALKLAGVQALTTIYQTKDSKEHGLTLTKGHGHNLA